jgi:hypothetical protein
MVQKGCTWESPASDEMTSRLALKRGDFWADAELRRLYVCSLRRQRYEERRMEDAGWSDGESKSR